MLHIYLLHGVGSSNPKEANGGSPEASPFYSYYFLKDIHVFLIVFTVFIYFVTLEPNFFGHPDNYIPADPIVTPAHIVPE